MQLKYVLNKTFKKQILTVVLPKKSASKAFIKTFPNYFSLIFLEHFSNRLDPNVKIIMAYFYILKLLKINCHFEFWVLF